MANDAEANSLYALLREVQLEHFYHAIKSIDVTKVEHFENVAFEDLTSTQVGMGPPAARRLLEAAKRRNNKWKKNLFNIILPNKPKDRSEERPSSGTVVNNSRFLVEAEATSDTAGLTCLISQKDIKLLDKLGDGSFGVVKRAQWTTPNSGVKYVAVKILKQDVIVRALEDFAKEVNSMHHLKHPNLIKLYGIVLSNPMMMVTELAEQGSLRSKLVKTLGRLALSTLVDYAVQIAKGLEYLETKCLVHRDIATRNIFITESNAIKIGDFGLMRSVPFGEDYYTMSDNVKVPFPWCAIESLKYRQFSNASDTWMYGVTLWEIFSFGQEPWAGLNGSQIIKKVEQGERLPLPNACSQKVYQVMNLCWKAEPKERPTFSSMITFFKNTKPIRLKALSDFESGSSSASSKFATFLQKDGTEKTYLKVVAGDEIEVVEGLSENYWWKGQSQRSFDIGIFPRCIGSKDMRTLNSNDISKPLKNSFIHTGHMDPMGKKSWGNPEFIEKMYLEHPIEPPDVLGFETNNGQVQPPDLETRGGEKKTVTNGMKKEISKIQSIDDLDEKENLGFEDNFKDDILIDFNSEITTVASSKAQEDFLSSIQLSTTDLLGLSFDGPSTSKSVIAPPPPLAPPARPPPPVFSATAPPPAVKDTTSRITRDLFEMDEPENVEVLPNNHRLLFDTIESLEPLPPPPCFAEKFDTEPTVESEAIGTIISIAHPVDLIPSSKYYAPPTESGLMETASVKNRYYSSVCSNVDFPSSVSNCDFPQTMAAPLASSYNPYLAGETTCQCCSNFYSPSTNTYIPNTSCFNGCNGYCDQQQQQEEEETYCPPADALPPPDLIGSNHTLDKTVNSMGAPAYQSQVCKDFIQELEANFARLGQVKLGEPEIGMPTALSATTIYPTINPPPRPNKIRRPAPPPPSGKKVN